MQPVALITFFNKWGVTDQSFTDTPNKQAHLFFQSLDGSTACFATSLRSFPHSELQIWEEEEAGCHFLRAKGDSKLSP